MIDVQHLHKTYRVPVREPGFANAVRSLWDRKFRDVHAVRDVSFRIEPGERVGFLGPNGAGKTTTLKMLTGLLHPSSGTVRVLDMVPQDRPRALLSRIAMVMGQKNGLLWDLPAPETFELHRALFDIPDATFRASRDELVELLQLGDFLDRPVRNLSLGQRMRCELAAALLHRPKVLFLDEPTIGLDVEVQVIVRAFIAEYNRRHNATVVLTSHNMDDVAAICDRVLLIDEGSLRFDGPLPELARRFGHGRRLTVRGPGLDLSEMGFERATQRDTWQRTDEPAAVNQALAAVLARWPDADLTVEDPPLEDVLRKAFQAKDGA